MLKVKISFTDDSKTAADGILEYVRALFYIKRINTDSKGQYNHIYINAGNEKR